MPPNHANVNQEHFQSLTVKKDNPGPAEPESSEASGTAVNDDHTDCGETESSGASDTDTGVSNDNNKNNADCAATKESPETSEPTEVEDAGHAEPESSEASDMGIAANNPDQDENEQEQLAPTAEDDASPFFTYTSAERARDERLSGRVVERWMLIDAITMDRAMNRHLADGQALLQALKEVQDARPLQPARIESLGSQVESWSMIRSNLSQRMWSQGLRHAVYRTRPNVIFFATPGLMRLRFPPLDDEVMQRRRQERLDSRFDRLKMLRELCEETQRLNESLTQLADDLVAALANAIETIRSFLA